MKPEYSSLTSRYGSCRDIPAPNTFLQPLGEGWKYPKWFINFLVGTAPKDAPLNELAIKLLEALLDGKWHRKTPHEVGVGTQEACVELGLVELRLIRKCNEPGASWGEYRITEEGKQVLKRNCLLPRFIN